MNTQHLTSAVVHAWRTRTLDSAQLLTVFEHLAECEECRHRVAPKEVESKLAAALGGEHVQYEGLEAIVHGSLDGLEHVAVCSLCAAELRDLEVFRLSLVKPIAPRRQVRIWAPLAGLVALAAIIALAVLLRPSIPLPKAPAPVPLVASLHDSGHIISLDQTGNLSGLGDLAPNDSAAIADALKTGRLPIAPADPDLLRNREILLGSQTTKIDLTPISPTGTLVSRDRPTFRWRAPPSAGAFQVRIYDQNFDLVTSSPLLGAREWTPLEPLPRNKTLSWTISATVGGLKTTAPQAPEPEAKFRIAPIETANEMLAARQAQPHSDLRVAAVAARLGLFDEAREAISHLDSENANSPLVAQLLKNLLK